MSPVATAGAVTCPYCREALEPGAPTRTCERCQTALHSDCAALHGRCTTFGCQGRAGDLAAMPPPSRRARPQVAHRRRPRPALLARLLRPRDDGALLAAAALGALWVLVRAL